MIINFSWDLYGFINSKVRKNHTTCSTYISNDYTNGGIEFKTELTKKKENTERRLQLVAQVNKVEKADQEKPILNKIMTTCD